MVAIDTNIIIRLLVRDNPELASKAESHLNALAAGEGMLDQLIIAEIGYVLGSYYGYSKQRICQVYELLLSDRRFHIPQRDMTSLAVSIFRSEKPLSFEDAWILALLRVGRITGVITFDKALARRASSSA